MAKHHTKGDKTETTNGDIPVVAPVNMGRTLKFEGTEYNVNVGTTLTVTENGLVETKLSSQAGNLLQKREDGLYYGIEAPPNLANLYVDAINGVDRDPRKVKGAGSKEMPLKTFAYAIQQADINSRRTIHLKEGQEHIVDCTANTTDIKSGFVYIVPYGDKYTENVQKDSQSNWVSNRHEFHQANLFPKLIFRGIKVRDYLREYSYIDLGIFRFMENTTLYFEYISLQNEVEGVIRASDSVSEKSVRIVECNRFTNTQRSNVNITFHFDEFKSKYNLTATEGSSINEPVSRDSIGFCFIQEGSVIFQKIIELDSSFAGNIIGGNGWTHGLNASSRVSIVGAGNETIQRSLAKKIRLHLVDHKYGNILAPTVDIPYDYFGF